MGSLNWLTFAYSIAKAAAAPLMQSIVNTLCD